MFTKLASIPSKPWVQKQIWVPKQSWSISETMQQQLQQQISQIKETLKFMAPLTFHGNILTELEKDVKNFAGGNLRYFNKNWYVYTKDKYILDVITNGLKLDLKELPNQIIRPTYPLSSKENEIISTEITKLLKMLVTV